MAYDDLLKQASSDYSSVLKGYQDRVSGGLGMIDSLGKNQLAQANRYYDQQGAAARTSAVSRGLGNSTVVDALQAGVNQQRSYDLQGINNNINQQKLGVYTGLTGDLLGYQERGGLNTVGLGERSLAYPLQERQLSLAERQGAASVGLMGAQQAALNRSGVAAPSLPYSGGGGGGGGGYGSGFGPGNGQTWGQSGLSMVTGRPFDRSWDNSGDGAFGSLAPGWYGAGGGSDQYGAMMNALGYGPNAGQSAYGFGGAYGAPPYGYGPSVGIDLGGDFGGGYSGY